MGADGRVEGVTNVEEGRGGQADTPGGTAAQRLTIG